MLKYTAYLQLYDVFILHNLMILSIFPLNCAASVGETLLKCFLFSMILIYAINKVETTLTHTEKDLIELKKKGLDYAL